MNEQKLAEDYLIFECMSGSRAYGTYSEHSDTDKRGIFIAPPEYGLGCLKNVEQVKIEGEDTVIFELAKFVRLAVDNNPNIIELLFTEDENVLFIDPAFKKIRDHRHLFLSRKAKYTFSGYAMSQMRRIRGHNKWINAPQPEDAPELLDFAKLILPNGDVHPGDAIKSFLNIFLVKLNATTFRIYSSPNFSKPPLSEDRHNLQYIEGESFKPSENSEFYGTLIVQLDTFRIQHRMWKNYWKWKKNRNPVRAELEKKHGYDVKHAMHLMRLLRMSHEILRDGKVIVHRPDAEELLAIRNGSFDYEELIKTAEDMEHKLDELYDNSPLPHTADKEAINALYIDVVQNYWRRMGL